MQIALFLQVFEACDEGNKGYLNREDFEVAVVMLFGYKLSEVCIFFLLYSEYPAYIDVLLLRKLFTEWSVLIGVDWSSAGEQKYLQILEVFFFIWGYYFKRM